MQGDFIELLNKEDEDITWKSIIYGVPKGAMSFACRAATNSLATNDNLVRWGKKSNSKCDLCSNKGSLCHVLNSCQKMLQDGRYTWRHDNILHALAKLLRENKKDHISFYVDIPKYNINGGTVPPNIVTTSERPDIVVIDNSTSPTTVLIYELTCPFETNIENAHAFKSDKYSSLASDIEDNGYSCMLVAFEIGSRGFIPRRVKLSLCSLLIQATNIKKPFKIMKFLSKLSLLSSYSIFHSRKETQWSDPPVLSL